MELNCILAGVGGQGTVLASKLIAGAAMEQGYFVRTAETIGMAQRGGSVVSHVRVGKNIHSPMVPKGSANLIIGFEPGEAVRCLPYLKADGTVIAADKAVRPVTDSLSSSSYEGESMIAFLREKTSRLILLDTAEIFRETGSSKVLNVALLGAAAASGALGISLDDMFSIIERKTPGAYLDSNRTALKIGAKAVATQ